MRYCTDFESPDGCCGSCHDEWYYGHHTPMEVYASDVDGVVRLTEEDPLLAMVCCRVYDSAVEQLVAEVP